ncbi:hypothetical protein [Winogradskyella aquimaris]|uniref:PH domain-containing protein n=1 Tax=Winogradskyella aquimaris TaxID=864074 RepID=A0ABU5ENF4_9FLAO|nr:hypothetical protein [Winogradskyella aquimaris]MDY2587980.1 hypothetical protein [Winogradskyella aquimaris]
MRYFITILTLMAILFIGQLFEFKLPHILNISLVILCFAIFILWEYNTLKKEYVADFKIRSQRKHIDIFNLLYSVFMTLLLWPWEGDRDIIYLISLFWIATLTELIFWFVYKKLKPNRIYIKDNTLILKNRWVEVRNVNELIKIDFNRFTNNLNLHFRTKSEVSINIKDYKPEDLEKLLEILIEKSDHDVFIPNGYKLKLKNYH